MDEDEMTVSMTADGRFAVMLGDRVLASLATNAEAWGWIDKHTDEGREDVERTRRIRSSSTFS